MALYDPQQHRASVFLYGDDEGVMCHSLDAWMLWFFGYPDQGKVRNDEAVTLAQQSAHPFSLSIILSFEAIFHQFRREVPAVQEHAEATIRVAQEQGFPYLIAFDSILRGWALVHQGQAQEGVEQITQSLMTYRATGAEILRPYWLALLAEAQGAIGEPEAGLTVVTEAMTVVDKTGERWHEPELYRLKGELLLQQNAAHQDEAETCFAQAITIAQSQQAKSWELRAATSLATLWQQQGKRKEAYDLLAPVYGWFTEGFDTADLKDAKTLLEELEDGR
jgi:predicted ATPase